MENKNTDKQIRLDKAMAALELAREADKNAREEYNAASLEIESEEAKSRIGKCYILRYEPSTAEEDGYVAGLTKVISFHPTYGLIGVLISKLDEVSDSQWFHVEYPYQISVDLIKNGEQIPLEKFDEVFNQYKKVLNQL